MVKLPVLHVLTSSVPVDRLQAALDIHIFTVDYSHRYWTSSRGCKRNSEDAGCSASEACHLPHRPGTSAVPASCTIQLSTWPFCGQVMSPAGFATVHHAFASSGSCTGLLYKMPSAYDFHGCQVQHCYLLCNQQMIALN